MAFFHVNQSSNHGDHLALLRDFLHDCVSSAPSEEADRLREAAFLLAGGGIEGREVDPARIEAMLAASAGESAALAILGADTAFMVSRGPNGRCLASLFGASSEEEIVAEGATIGLALLGAFASALISRMESEEPENAIWLGKLPPAAILH